MDTMQSPWDSSSDLPSLSSISPLSISMTHRQASEWVTSATPHAAGTSGGITAHAIAFFFFFFCLEEK